MRPQSFVSNVVIKKLLEAVVPGESGWRVVVENGWTKGRRGVEGNV